MTEDAKNERKITTMQSPTPNDLNKNQTTAGSPMLDNATFQRIRESLVETGVDALFALLDGEVVEIGGSAFKLVRQHG